LQAFLINPSNLREQYALSSSKWRSAWERNKLDYKRIKGLCKKNKAKMLILLIPAPFQLNRFYLSEWVKYGIDLDNDILEWSSIQDEMEHFCSSEGIPLLDLFSAFKIDTGQQYYYVEDGHWNKRGHQLAAKMIYNRLKNDEVVF